MTKIDDSELYRSFTSGICWRCTHHRVERTCDAFPDRIPDDIWDGENDHTKPFEGDNGIRFEEST